MSKTTAFKLAAIVVILGAATFLVVQQRKGRPITVGEGAPDFSIPALPTGTMNLDSYRGQIVVLNLWATWCPPCVEETPSLVRFAERMKAHGVVVLGVSVDEDTGALKDFIDKNQIRYPIGRDPDRSLSARFGTYQFPETYILDRRGKVAEKLIGAIDWDDNRIQSFVQNLADGQKP